MYVFTFTCFMCVCVCARVCVFRRCFLCCYFPHFHPMQRGQGDVSIIYPSFYPKHITARWPCSLKFNLCNNKDEIRINDIFTSKRSRFWSQYSHKWGLGRLAWGSVIADQLQACHVPPEIRSRDFEIFSLTINSWSSLGASLLWRYFVLMR